MRTGVLFGRICIQEDICPICKESALIIDAQFSCCGHPAEDKQIEQYRRESDPQNRKRCLSKKQKTEQLKRQEYKCFYCNRTFGSIVFKYNQAIELKIHFDHKIPFVFSRDNGPSNFVAACHVCNGIKSDFVFDTKEATLDFINRRWEELGYCWRIKAA